MKYTLLLIIFSSITITNTNAQFSRINLNSINQLNSLVKIGNTIIVNGWNSAFRTNDYFNTISELMLPNDNSWNNIMKQMDNKLYLLAYTSDQLHTRFYESVDTGLTWNLKLDTTFFHATTFSMYDSLHGVVLGINDHKLSTQDGGLNWSLGDYPSAYFIYTSNEYGDSIMIAGTFNSIIYSTNRGITNHYKGIDNNAIPADIYILNKDTFFTVGETSDGTVFLAYSLYGIDSFKTRYAPIGTHMSCVWANHVTNIYTAGNTYDSVLKSTVGIIYKTNDLGLTWSSFNSGINTKFYDILFINDSIAYVCGSNGVLLRWKATSLIPISPEENNISINPNPSNANQSIIISSTKNDKLMIDLLDMSGKKIDNVYNGNTTIGKTNIESNISKLANGIYQYRIQIGSQTKYIKINKQ